MNTPFVITVFFLLSVYQTTVCSTSAIIGTLCPTNCSCSMPDGSGRQLTVDCLGRAYVASELLTKQLNSLLSSDLTYGRVISLSIINSPLTHVPRSICRLTTLTQLRLDNNRLTRLPDNCFTNLTALMSLSASTNNITELQDGLFDGLHRLERLELGHNRISSIGLRVFNGSAMLTSLKYVDLSVNRIQTLEPWFYYVGINGQPDDKAPVELGYNNISSFTNMMGLKAKCGMKTMHVDLGLGYNPIKHITDILRGWNISLTTFWCLSPSIGRSSSYFHLRGVKLDCDCVDFDVLKLILSTHTDMLNRAFCNRPASLYDRQVATVPLDQFVCELTELCPPGCRCVHRPANATLHIYCSNTNITVLPSQLPQLPKSYTKYKLDFSNNRLLRRLEQRAYFLNTYILDVSNCNLESIDFEVWNDLANMTQVFLDGNQLQSLHPLVATVNLVKTNVGLSRNPWKCFCDASWMSDWLKSVRNNIINPDSVVCSSPTRLENRNVIGISREEFCVDPTSEAVKRTLTISLSAVTGAILVLLSAVVIVFRLRVRLYTRWKFHPFDRDECLGEDMDFDLFLSSSSKDNSRHGNRIREKLEQRGYRVCYPPRDFLGGGAIADNIYSAIVRSKRVVCLLTANFLQRFVFVICSCSCLAILKIVFQFVAL